MFEIGASVRVIEGPFASFVGTVESFDGQKELYSVNVNIFGRMAPVDLSEIAMEAA